MHLVLCCSLYCCPDFSQEPETNLLVREGAWGEGELQRKNRVVWVSVCCGLGFEMVPGKVWLAHLLAGSVTLWSWQVLAFSSYNVPESWCVYVSQFVCSCSDSQLLGELPKVYFCPVNEEYLILHPWGSFNQNFPRLWFAWVWQLLYLELFIVFIFYENEFICKTPST